MQNFCSRSVTYSGKYVQNRVLVFNSNIRYLARACLERIPTSWFSGENRIPHNNFNIIYNLRKLTLAGKVTNKLLLLFRLKCLSEAKLKARSEASRQSISNFDF